MSEWKTPAVVVGLCPHGLAVVRALARRGVPVHAVESDTTRPGCRTRHAIVATVPDVNGPSLVSSLVRLADTIGREYGPPVLFLTNDNMVRRIAENRDVIVRNFRLSWGGSANVVLDLLSKDSLEGVCRTRGMAYPRSKTIHTTSEVRNAIRGLQLPLIAKPVRPLSRFKVRKADSVEQLEEIVGKYASELPIVAQEWIEGGDESIFFCALYLEGGRIVDHFIGRKIESSPPTLGQTLIAEVSEHPGLIESACRFFEGSGLTGPASIEFKIDREKRPWVIEPTVGRTDYWVDCCVAGGFNVPYLEYVHQVSGVTSGEGERRKVIWFDTDRDPLAYLRHAVRGRTLKPRGKLPVFPYLGHGDLRPLGAALLSSAASLAGRGFGRLVRSARRSGSRSTAGASHSS